MISLSLLILFLVISILASSCLGKMFLGSLWRMARQKGSFLVYSRPMNSLSSFSLLIYGNYQIMISNEAK